MVETLVKKIAGEIIPIDEKTIRGSYDRNQSQSALHVISAWSSEQRLVLGQLKVEDKSNEITAIPALLELLDITGSIITIDAMGTQTEIAKKIFDKKGDYVLALKANHPTLYSQVSTWFKNATAQNFPGIDVSYDRRLEKGHHRREIRQVWSVPVTAIPNLYQPRLARGTSKRCHGCSSPSSLEQNYSRSSVLFDFFTQRCSTYWSGNPKTLGD